MKSKQIKNKQTNPPQTPPKAITTTKNDRQTNKQDHNHYINVNIVQPAKEEFFSTNRKHYFTLTVVVNPFETNKLSFCIYLLTVLSKFCHRDARGCIQT